MYHKFQYWDPYILFLIFINDLDCDITNWVLKFADDTKIFEPVCNQSDYMKFQEDLNRLFSWSTDWQMLFNVEKCKIMQLEEVIKYMIMVLNLDGSILKEVAVEKDLGVMHGF